MEHLARPRLTIFQHGDFGEAYRRLASGGMQNYRGQIASVNFVADLAGSYEVTTIAICSRRHDETLAPGLRSIGIDEADAHDRRKIDEMLAGLRPDLIVCRSPYRQILAWAARHDIPTLASFADNFSGGGWRQLLRNVRLRAVLGAPAISCVANHSLNASRSLARPLFYPRDGIVPWDWERLPVRTEIKAAPRKEGSLYCFFAGALIEQKGVGDCLEALAQLKARGLSVYCDFAGGGDIEPWHSRAAALGLEDRVSFLGLVDHDEVSRRMADADAVIVPSRHDYNEGLPNTIYEALAARTPLLISDHPAFAGRILDGVDCLVFRAADPRSLAERLETLLKDRGLYAALSARSAAAHDGLYVGMEWTALVSAFLSDPRDENGWVAANSLATLEKAWRDAAR